MRYIHVQQACLEKMESIGVICLCSLAVLACPITGSDWLLLTWSYRSTITVLPEAVRHPRVTALSPKKQIGYPTKVHIRQGGGVTGCEL